MSAEFPKLSLSELEFVRQHAPDAFEQMHKMREALIKAQSECSWCDGSGQDNDGESFVNEACHKCKYLVEALT